jgi:hypothetical protein
MLWELSVQWHRLLEAVLTLCRSEQLQCNPSYTDSTTSYTAYPSSTHSSDTTPTSNTHSSNSYSSNTTIAIRLWCCMGSVWR